MPLLAGFQRWYAKHKLRQATIAAAIAGGSITAWPIATPHAEVVPAAQAWLADRLATVRTPRGIDTCGLALKLVQQEGGRWRRLWSVQMPCFARHTPQETYQALAQQILALPLADYPDATHIELHLVSIGDIVAYQGFNPARPEELHRTSVR